MAKIGFILLGVSVFIAVLVGVGIYSIFTKKIRKQKTTWVGILVSGLISPIVVVSGLYMVTESFMKSVERSERVCFYKISTDQENGRVVSILIDQGGSIWQDICFQENGLTSDIFKCKASQRKLVTLNEKVIFGNTICEPISNYQSK